MDTIICLVGASGSGKTTIAKELDKLDYNIIHSYTTRKPRKENEWGHIFIDNIEEILGIDYNNLLKKGILKYMGDKVIAFFNNYSKNEIYFATENQYKNKGISVYIIDPKGAEQVKENVKDAKVITIFMSTYWDVCRRRMFKDTVRTPKQVINRVEVDKELFSRVKCDYVVDANMTIEKVLNNVVSIIENIGDVDE